MLRSEFLRGVGATLLLILATPLRFARATAPQDTQPNSDKTLTPEERMKRRYPQPVKVGFLVGLPMLDEQDSTYGYIRDVVRTAEGRILFLVPYRAWLGWAPTDWGRKVVAVPIEAVAILARQVAALDFSRDDFAAAPTYGGDAKPISPDETIQIAVYRR